MGGFGSGRTGGRPVVEDGLTLDFGYVRRLGAPGGKLWWSHGDVRIASIGWGLDLAAKILKLNYVVGDGRRNVEQLVRLTTTLPHFGGTRWWMVCPATGKSVGKLHNYPGCDYFVSREALGMAYRSQREHSMDRALRRARKGLIKLGGTGNMDEANNLRKPKWMRWSTYERKMAQAQAAAHAWDAAFCAKAATLLDGNL